MSAKNVDVSSLLPGLLCNDVLAFKQLAEKFANGRFHIPITTTKGVRNSLDFVKEAGADLPVHLLSLSNGRKAAGFFTNRHTVKNAEKKLSWKTDDRRLKSLSVSGTVMAGYAEKLFDAGAIDWVILNPCHENETHLSQSELLGFAKGKAPTKLSLYLAEPGPSLYGPPTVVGSLADVALSKADSFFKQVSKHIETLSNVSHQSTSSNWSSGFAEPMVLGGNDEKLNELTGQLFTLFSKVPPDGSSTGLWVNVNKQDDDVQVTVSRPVPDDVLQQAHQVVRDTLTGPGTFQLTLDFSAVSQMSESASFAAPAWSPPVSKKPAPPKKTGPEKKQPPAPESARSAPTEAKEKSRRFQYIPLEPEPTSNTGEE